MSKKLQFNNTYESGHYTLLVIKEGKKYTGVCLEFDLIIKAETLDRAKERIMDYTKAWLENIQKNRLPEELLNRAAPDKYWGISDLIDKNKKQLTQTSPRSSPRFSMFEDYRQHGFNFAS